MIDPQRLYEFFQKNGIEFYTGVPDSLLKPFLKYLNDHSDKQQHIIAANEGLAVGLAIGYHLSTGKLPLVYLQNSGLGNIINPITSLADPEVYSIPMLLMIGWRGRPGIHDEPQHKKMGRVTIATLEAMEIPFFEIGDDEVVVLGQLATAVKQATTIKGPVALLVKEKVFKDTPEPDINYNRNFDRHVVIGKLIDGMKGDEIVVCTTGFIGRDFYDQNVMAHNKISKYFLSVGGMGHANHIALSLHMRQPAKTIVLDGDGAVLMHMGGLPTIAGNVKGDFIHIVLNNGSHESVGGQSTEALSIDLVAIAKSCGYRSSIRVENPVDLDNWIKNDLNKPGLQFVEIIIDKNPGNVPGRPSASSVELKKILMGQLGVD